jgi:purine-binding chemotaxis protein CheW
MTEKQTFLTFLLGQEYFAVHVTKVLEVLEKQHITKVPQTPEHILGIINFRGDILPVIDTRQKFNLASVQDDDKQFVIVYDLTTESRKLTVAATADAVKDVIEISPSDVKPVPEMGINYDSRYISGVMKQNDDFIMLLDIDKVFALSDCEAVEALAAVDAPADETA